MPTKVCRNKWAHVTVKLITNHNTSIKLAKLITNHNTSIKLLFYIKFKRLHLKDET